MINYNLETHNKLSCVKIFLIFILKFGIPTDNLVFARQRIPFRLGSSVDKF